MALSRSPSRARDIASLRESLLDLTAVINSPKPDAALIAAAGVELDRALFPLISRLERHGSLGIKELADFVGRDYTTVSRQVSKLESLRLVAREADANDGRISRATLTPDGRKMTAAIDRARRQQFEPLLARWSDDDIDALVRLLRLFADDMTAWMKDPEDAGRAR